MFKNIKPNSSHLPIFAVTLLGLLISTIYLDALLESKQSKITAYIFPVIGFAFFIGAYLFFREFINGIFNFFINIFRFSKTEKSISELPNLSQDNSFQNVKGTNNSEVIVPNEIEILDHELNEEKLTDKMYSDSTNPNCIAATDPTLESLDNIQRNRQEWKLEKERKDKEIFDVFIKYTRKTLSPYISDGELIVIEKYIKQYVDRENFNSTKQRINPEILKNTDLFRFGWNLVNHFKITSNSEVVPWLQKVFKKLENLEYSYIYGKLYNDNGEQIIKNIKDITMYLEDFENIE